MNTPSIKTIMTQLEEPLRKQAGFSPKRAAVLIRAYMMAADTTSRVDDALDSISDILGGYGVESIKDNRWEPYYCDIGLLYVNLGDTYIQTVCYDTRKGQWLICSWGDIVERNEKRFTDK